MKYILVPSSKLKEGSIIGSIEVLRLLPTMKDCLTVMNDCRNVESR